MILPSPQGNITYIHTGGALIYVIGSLQHYIHTPSAIFHNRFTIITASTLSIGVLIYFSNCFVPTAFTTTLKTVILSVKVAMVITSVFYFFSRAFVPSQTCIHDDMQTQYTDYLFTFFTITTALLLDAMLTCLYTHCKIIHAW